MDLSDENLPLPVEQIRGLHVAHRRAVRRQRILTTLLATIVASAIAGCNLSYDVEASAGRASSQSMNPIHELSVSSDGRRLAMQYWSGKIEVRDVKSERVIATLHHRRPHIDSLALSGDGSRLAVGLGNGDIMIHNLDDSSEKIVLGNRGVSAINIAFSSDDRRLVSGGSHPNDPVVRVWDIQDRKLVAEFRDLPSSLMFVSFTDNDRSVAFSCGEGSVFVRSIQGTRKCDIREKSRYFLLDSAITRDGTRIATCGQNGLMTVYNSTTGAIVWRKKVDRCLHSVSFSGDGRLLAFGDEEGLVEVRRSDSGDLRNSMRIHEGAVRRLKFHPQEKTFYTAGFDGTWWGTPVPESPDAVAPPAPVDADAAARSRGN